MHTYINIIEKDHFMLSMFSGKKTFRCRVMIYFFFAKGQAKSVRRAKCRFCRDIDASLSVCKIAHIYRENFQFLILPLCWLISILDVARQRPKHIQKQTHNLFHRNKLLSFFLGILFLFFSIESAKDWQKSQRIACCTFNS